MNNMTLVNRSGLVTFQRAETQIYFFELLLDRYGARCPRIVCLALIWQQILARGTWLMLKTVSLVVPISSSNLFTDLPHAIARSPLNSSLRRDNRMQSTFWK